MAEIILSHVSKRYGRGHGPFAVKDLSLGIRDMEFMVFLGPSGCGKTSTLRMIAGLEEITEGNLSFDDKRVNDLPPQSRDVAMAFENYALYPTLSVKDNIEFPLKVRHWPQSRIDEKVAWVAQVGTDHRYSSTQTCRTKRRTAAAGISGSGHRPGTAGIPVRRTPFAFGHKTKTSDADADKEAAFSAPEDHDLCNSRPE